MIITNSSNTKYRFRHRRARSNSASAISEVPPALFLLLFCAVFPMLNLIFLGLTYSSCALLNKLELRIAAQTPSSELQPALAAIQQKWQSTGIGQFAGVTAPPACNVTYSNLGTDIYVNVATTFTVKSFVSIPFFAGVPGLGAPWTYTIAGKRVLENPSYASS